MAVAAAILALIAWLFLRPDDPAFVLERVVTVLVIACPHALGLAIRLVAQISASIGAKRGILVRSRLALETTRTIGLVLFDKTGTLTEGRQGVVDVVAVRETSADEVLAFAPAAEAQAEHPIARAIVAEAKSRELASVGRASSLASLAGRGVDAVVAGREVTVASARLVNERGLTIGSDLVYATRSHTGSGKTVVYVVDSGAVVGMIAVADVIRPESAEAVRLLKDRGGLPLAAGVLAGVGVLMPPAVGAALMAVSTIVVALNAQLLRFIRFARG